MNVHYSLTLSRNQYEILAFPANKLHRDIVLKVLLFKSIDSFQETYLH